MSFQNISFTDLLAKYEKFQSKVKAQISSISTSTCSTSPSQFLMAQFQMSQMTQMGDSISNMISQMNAVINNSIRNFKA